MPNQQESLAGLPTKDSGRPSPDVEDDATDGQSDARGKGASDAQGRPPGTGSERNGPSDTDRDSDKPRS